MNQSLANKDTIKVIETIKWFLNDYLIIMNHNINISQYNCSISWLKARKYILKQLNDALDHKNHHLDYLIIVLLCLILFRSLGYLTRLITNINIYHNNK